MHLKISFHPVACLQSSVTTAIFFLRATYKRNINFKEVLGEKSHYTKHNESLHHLLQLVDPVKEAFPVLREWLLIAMTLGTSTATAASLRRLSIYAQQRLDVFLYWVRSFLSALAIHQWSRPKVCPDSQEFQNNSSLMHSTLLVL